MTSSTARQLEDGDELTDPVTGLAKALVEMDHARHAFARARAGGTSVGVVVVDIDGFGRVDEGDGWAAGDEVLCQVGRRIRSVLRDGDRVTRLSGDVFAAFCAGSDYPAAIGSLERRILDVLHAPVTFAAGTLALRVSTGTAMSPGTGSPEALAIEAEVAMRRARRQRPTARRLSDLPIGSDGRDGGRPGWSAV